MRGKKPFKYHAINAHTFEYADSHNPKNTPEWLGELMSDEEKNLRPHYERIIRTINENDLKEILDGDIENFKRTLKQAWEFFGLNE